MEVDYLLIPMLQGLEQALNTWPSRQPVPQVVLAQAANIPDAWIHQRIKTLPNLKIHVVQHQNHAVLSVADLTLAASGTTTLEAALYGCPMVLMYKGPWLSYQLVKNLMRVPYLGLPNLILGNLQPMKTPLVPELWQYEVTADNIARYIHQLLGPNSVPGEQQKAGFQKIRQLLCPQDKEASNLASSILSQLLLHKAHTQIQENPIR
jgi:lipid-A-disaccharide synthase